MTNNVIKLNPLFSDQMMSAHGDHIEAIYEALVMNKKKVTFKRPIENRILYPLFRNILVDVPSRFEIDPLLCGYDRYGCTTTLDFHSTLKKNEIHDMRELIDLKVEYLYHKLNIASCRGGLEIERKVHDWVVQNTLWCDYMADNDVELYFDNHRLTGILLSGQGVCESIAKTITLLLNKFGVRCHTVCGYPDKNNIEHKLLPAEVIRYYQDYINKNYPDNYNECTERYNKPVKQSQKIGNPGWKCIEDIEEQKVYIAHAWNYVEINGKWYHLDVNGDYDRGYKYFNFNDIGDRSLFIKDLDNTI